MTYFKIIRQKAKKCISMKMKWQIHEGWKCFKSRGGGYIYDLGFGEKVMLCQRKQRFSGLKKDYC